ncbi:MAG: hypothetical protein ACE5IF_05290 [Candidatus Bathyarchaeia archaeon]
MSAIIRQPTNTQPADAQGVTFYQTVRETIQGLDNLILTLLLSGSVFLVAFLGVAGFLHKNIECVGRWPVGAIGASLVSLIAILLDLALIIQLRLYISFLGEAVEIAKKIEEELVRSEYQMTHRFERQMFAGIRGKQLFPWILYGMGTLALAGLAFFAYLGFQGCPDLKAITPNVHAFFGGNL